MTDKLGVFDLFHTLPKRERIGGLLSLEKLMLIYAALTTVLLLVLWGRMTRPMELLEGRLQVVGGMCVLWALYRLYPSRLTICVRVTAQLALLSYWYPDTYEFNRLFPNLDHVFATWEQQLFGGQPAMWFGKLCPNAWFSEAFNLGYFAYYPMIAVVIFFYFLRRYSQYLEASFVVLCSFFLYYLFYIFVPVAGPQFYFPAIGAEAVAQGVFQPVGDYFSYHTDIMPGPGDTDGLFYSLVRGAQDAGERPTAAFPSSHIGISTILLILAFRVSHRLGWMLMPFFVLLCCATVYIRAHYAIDAIAGLASAPLAYLLSKEIYRRFFVRSN